MLACCRQRNNNDLKYNEQVSNIEVILHFSAMQVFPGAERIVQDLGSVPAIVTVRELQEKRMVQDDRIEMSMNDGAIFFHIPGQ